MCRFQWSWDLKMCRALHSKVPSSQIHVHVVRVEMNVYPFLQSYYNDS